MTSEDIKHQLIIISDSDVDDDVMTMITTLAALCRYHSRVIITGDKSFKLPFENYSFTGKIQRDGRKFLDRFKSYFGSQISPQSLN